MTRNRYPHSRSLCYFFMHLLDRFNRRWLVDDKMNSCDIHTLGTSLSTQTVRPRLSPDCWYRGRGKRNKEALNISAADDLLLFAFVPAMKSRGPFCPAKKCERERKPVSHFERHILFLFLFLSLSLFCAPIMKRRKEGKCAKSTDRGRREEKKGEVGFIEPKQPSRHFRPFFFLFPSLTIMERGREKRPDVRSAMQLYTLASQ